MKNLLKPSTPSDTIGRYNADGFLVYSPGGANGSYSYVQLFRNGCLEYGDGHILNVGRVYGAGRENDVPSIVFEKMLVETFGNALRAITRIGVGDPVYFSCTLVGVQGLRLTQAQIALNYIGTQHTFDRQIIQTPEAQIDRAESSPYRNSVLPVVNSIWQANGYERTPFEGSPGDWNPLRH